MRTPNLYFPYRLWHKLGAFLLADCSLETMAMALFSTSVSASKRKLLVHRLILPTATDYATRSSAFVALSPAFIERCHAACESEQVHLLDIHTHPWSERVRFSSIDDREALDTKIPYMEQYLPKSESAFLVMGQETTIVEARLWDKNSQRLLPIPQIHLV